jgi:hypothetical protein
MCSARKLPLIDLQGVDSKERLMFCILSMKMLRRVIVVVDVDDNSKEFADTWHEELSFALQYEIPGTFARRI